jgi:hypothetical protein
MTKYENGKIYKIVNSDETKVYYGSTCEPTLARRLAKHVHTYKQFLKNNHNDTKAFDIIADGDYKILLVEKYPCHSKDELHAREGWYIKNNECINKNVAGRKPNQYYKEVLKAKSKEIREKNKDKIKQWNKKYELLHVEQIRNRKNSKNECLICGGKYTTANKAKHMKSLKHINAMHIKI